MNLKEAADYFKMSAKDMEKFTEKHKDEINSEDIHVINIQGQWAYDGTAIKIIEKLRNKATKNNNYLTSAKVDRVEKMPDTKLKPSIEQQLTATMAELTKTALALVDAERRNSSQQEQLATLKERAKTQEKQIAKLEENERKLKKQALDALQYQADLKAERAMLQAKINRIRNLPWWKRIFMPD